MRLAWTLAALAALLMLPASASARPADGQLWSEIDVAQSYWAHRGYTACAVITPTIGRVPTGAPDKDGAIAKTEAEGWSALGSCTMALVPRFAAKTRAWTDYFDLRYECAIVVHEAGHALGLTHEDAGTFPVMGQGMWDEAIPGRCRAWARATVRARRAASARADAEQ